MATAGASTTPRTRDATREGLFIKKKGEPPVFRMGHPGKGCLKKWEMLFHECLDGVLGEEAF
jgi:hypothetical protein